MESNFNKNSNIEFNENYDKGLMQTAHARIMISHIEQIYPRVYENLSLNSMIERYIDPKINKQLLLEQEYRDQGYPLNGVQELAFNDISEFIKTDLKPYEKLELLSQFDLDIHPVIDTEEIK